LLPHVWEIARVLVCLQERVQNPSEKVTITVEESNKKETNSPMPSLFLL